MIHVLRKCYLVRAQFIQHAGGADSRLFARPLPPADYCTSSPSPFSTSCPNSRMATAVLRRVFGPARVSLNNVYTTALTDIENVKLLCGDIEHAVATASYASQFLEAPPTMWSRPAFACRQRFCMGPLSRRGPGYGAEGGSRHSAF
jgi:hypothetical protein